MSAARDVTRPHIGLDDAAALASSHFRVAGDVSELPSERDRNFLIEGDERHVLKISHADTREGSLTLQERCLQRLAHRQSTVRVPGLVATRDGHSHASVDIAGTSHFVRLVLYLPGRTLGSLRPKTMRILSDVGSAAGAMLTALAGFDDAAIPERFPWDLRNAPEHVASLLPSVADGRRSALEQLTIRAGAAISEVAADLPISVIHGDLNDHNVLVGDRIGVIDFGDVHRSYRVAEVAIAAAYGGFGFVDPAEAIAAVVAGACEIVALSDAEVAAVAPLVTLRLALSVAMGAEQMAADPGNAYLAISQLDAWETLDRLEKAPHRLVTARVREACGRAPVPVSMQVAAWLDNHSDHLASPLALAIDEGSTAVIDWSVTSAEAAHPSAAPAMDVQTRRTFELMRQHEAQVGLGRYGEPRLVYAAPEFAVPTNRGPAARTVHLGVDLSCPPLTAVRALYAGFVERAEIEALDGGYGPVVTLRHEPADGPKFYTLYGHLDAASISGLVAGQRIAAGEQIAAVGEAPDNGNWPPHLHFQLIADHLDLDGPFPGVALPEHWSVWSALSPSPAGALGLPATMVDAPHPDDAAIVNRRAELLPPSLSTGYQAPLVAVRGFGAYLYDGWGRAHLDCVNNVAHVGHEHPRVVAALAKHAALLNTNSRYPHPERIRYLERLLALFPDHLGTAFLVCTGSEANDLALRIARTVTGRREIVVVEGAYHGHTTDLIAASPYKHAGPGGSGKPRDVHIVPMPDPYRNPAEIDGSAVVAAMAAASSAGGAAAFIAESMPGVAGQIVPPAGWLEEGFAAARAAGALAIADEVQVGLGRIGSHWWGFERDGAVPDIVTLGKPLGNGHPLAAVVTTHQVAAAFANGMEYFNTFGGNPVSCAVGNAVLDVMEAEDLRGRAADVGAHLRTALEHLAERHRLIGDVRGVGMFLGIELVTDRVAQTPAPSQATYVTERARHLGVLLSVDGVHHNVLKLKPPLAFGFAEADRLVSALDDLLTEDAAQPGANGR